jgi:NADH-quinone oxidoreductase subunit C
LADGQQVAALLEGVFPGAVASKGAFRDQHWVEIRVDRLLEVARWLRGAPEARFEFLTDVTAVHWPDDPEPMEIVYHFFSLERNDCLRVKVRTGDHGPVPSLCGLWNSANWNEREVFDMFGVTFDGHPDLRRILMPDDYTDHPLRKELPLYRG